MAGGRFFRLCLSDGASGCQSPRLTTPSSLGDTSRADAARADTHAFPGFADDNVNVLKVRVPSTLRQIVGMTNPVPVNRAFIANLTTSHEGNSFEK